MTRPRSRSTQAKQPPARPSARHASLLWLGAILVLTFAVYIPSLDNGFTNWDDNVYVTNNPLLTDPNVHAVVTTPIAGNYHPLTIWSLALNYQIAGLRPASYHWLSLLLHLANTALVFLFIRKLTGGAFWATVITALFFGIHPMHVESVAWVAERKDVLYGFFYLLGLLAYWTYLERSRPIWLGAALTAHFLAAASKPAAVVFPLTLLALDYYRRRPWGLRVFVEKAPFFLVSLVTGLFTLKAQHDIGAIAEQWTFFHRVLFATYGVAMYVVKLFVPTHLSVIYPKPPAGLKSIGPEFYISFAAVVILVPTIFYAYRRVRPVVFGLLFFFIHIVLVLQLFTVGAAIMADRYTYLPYIGLFFALTWGLDHRSGALPGGRILKPLIAASMILLIPLSLYQTWRRCEVWKDTETLWNDAIERFPNRLPDAYNNRGYYYYTHGKQFDKALRDYNKALELNPRVPRSWFNKGQVLAELGQNDSALVYFDRVIELKPDYVDAWNNRGAVRLQIGNLSGAVADLSHAIAQNPTHRDAYANRAVAYTRIPDYERAVADARVAIRLDPKNPKNPELFDAIGVCLQKLNRPQEALAAHNEAIRMAARDDPRRAGYILNRCFAWRALGDRRRALDDAREALRLGARVDGALLRELGG